MPIEGLEELQNAGEVKEDKTVEVPDKDIELDEEETSQADLDLIASVEGDKLDKDKELEDKELEDKDKITDDEFAPRPDLKVVTAKYPNLFKDFPQLRDMYFREKQLTEVFPTLEEAKTAKEDLEGLQALEIGLQSGKVEDASSVLSAIKELSDEALPNFALNFLPALQKINNDAYYSVITPVMVDIATSLYQAGVKNENDNLKNAAMVMSHYFLGNKKIASGEEKLSLPTVKVKEEPKKEEVNERQKFEQERYNALYSDVDSDYDTQIKSTIKEGLDPDEVMSSFMKDALVNAIQNRINKVLGADTNHAANMKVLWAKAASQNYNSSWKARIISAALARAKAILPAIRNKARAEALGTKEREADRLERSTSKTEKVEGARTGSVSRTGDRSMAQIGRMDPKKIDWKKTTDLDVIQGKVTLKS